MDRSPLPPRHRPAPCAPDSAPVACAHEHCRCCSRPGTWNHQSPPTPLGSDRQSEQTGSARLLHWSPRHDANAETLQSIYGRALAAPATTSLLCCACTPLPNVATSESGAGIHTDTAATDLADHT